MKYWAFDLDGTLVDSLEVYFINLRALLNHHQISIPEEDLKKCLTMTLPDFLALYLDKNKVETAYKKMKEKSIQDAHKISMFQGVGNLLDSLKSQSSGLSLWTAREKESTEAILYHTGLDRYFDLVVTGCCITKPKPDPEGLLKIMDHYNCTVEEITMVGDHDVDILAARSLKVRPIRVTYKSNYLNVHEQKKCDISFRQFFHVDDFHSWISNK